ncbi:hypothetical protein JZU46_06610 [bacterium]|nr:hypothetical protein [bacterium]
MSNSKFPKDVEGFIEKGKDCEYIEYCSKSGSRCCHNGENRTIKYHCGYCKSFRMIDEMRKARGEKVILESLK